MKILLILIFALGTGSAFGFGDGPAYISLGGSIASPQRESMSEDEAKHLTQAKFDELSFDEKVAIIVSIVQNQPDLRYFISIEKEFSELLISRLKADLPSYTINIAPRIHAGSSARYNGLKSWRREVAYASGACAALACCPLIVPTLICGDRASEKCAHMVFGCPSSFILWILTPTKTGITIERATNVNIAAGDNVVEIIRR